ncbi:MAG: hypothetical protein RIS35_3293 [Pseudomonadota bacterium]
MRPLTDHCPKPLLEVGGQALIVWHLERLARAGIERVVINHAHLGAQLESALGDGTRWGVRIDWSPEREALETAGGIANALPLLGPAPFLVINGDVWCDFDLRRATPQADRLARDDLDAWCLLVPNPEHHPDGDFGLDDGWLSETAMPRATFSGIGVYRPDFFAAIEPGTRAPLGRMLREAARARRAVGERHDGCWVDVGTPQRLAQLDERLRNRT